MNIQVNVPDGISGDWKVESFIVSKDESHVSNIRSMFSNGGRGGLPSGNYKKLTRNGSIIMSNTPDEISDFMSFYYYSGGHVLINGLGLGVLVQALIHKKEVRRITIIEKSQDVINLSGLTYLKSSKVEIIHADAFEYKSPKGIRYNAVWHDIWDVISSDNLPEMKKLHRKYGRKTDYQESWCRWRCEDQKKREKEVSSYFY